MVSLSYPVICERLKKINLPEVDLVVGIGSGGIVPAALIAFYLNADLSVITINYRDENNDPRQEMPIVINLPDELVSGGKRILLVDDVSVSGKTLQTASRLLAGNQITTMTMKGKADFVIFPEIQDCVKWPWKV
jgi:uncharacterized protein